MDMLHLSSRNVTQAYGEWLQSWCWDWWVTLTFRHQVTPRQAHRIWKWWLHSLEKTVQGKVHYVRATEIQRFRGDIPHYHALLLGVKNEPPSVWEGVWYQCGGLTEIELYNPELGATYYLAKHVHNELGDIIFSKGIEKTKISTQLEVPDYAV